MLAPDEAPHLNESDTAAGAAIANARGKPFAKGNKAAKGRKPALASIGVPLSSADPAYARALRHAARYRRRRCSELARSFGGYLSAGASSLVASASLALAASRYLYEVAATTGDADTLKRASALANDARQGELAALELASRESAARPKATVDPLAAWRDPKS